MRIAIPSDGGGLDGAVGAHFGRCSHFVLVDLEGTSIQSAQEIANPLADSHEPGQVPQFIASQGVQVMVAAGMGWRALAAFEQLGIQAATGASGSVRNTLESYLAGNLQGGEPCTEGGHGE